MVRGEVWWANLPEPTGSAPAKRRPVLVIQSDNFNRSAINTVVCAMITSNTALANLPGNLFLEKAASGLDKSSVVNFSQIATIDEADLTELAGMLAKNVLSKVNAAIKTVLRYSMTTKDKSLTLRRDKI
ncbi:MAG: type II toxin-antitoxin system PemK/MazF family toxin [Spirochaetaceae bacterium]|jgi:mRNA interferase MazF|nr:type II toxin-antitoxin system PemK/MazF family toxin [Spirochaetaceae bacterium]